MPGSSDLACLMIRRAAFLGALPWSAGQPASMSLNSKSSVKVVMSCGPGSDPLTLSRHSKATERACSKQIGHLRVGQHLSALCNEVRGAAPFYHGTCRSD